MRAEDRRVFGAAGTALSASTSNLGQVETNNASGCVNNIVKCYMDYFWMRFGPGVTLKELLSIARIVCLKTGLHLKRKDQRTSKDVILWFARNWSLALPTLEKIHLLDENKNIIDLQFECSMGFNKQKKL